MLNRGLSLPNLLCVAFAGLLTVSTAHAQFGLPGGQSTTVPGTRGSGGGLGVGSYDTKNRPTPDRVVSGVVQDKDGNAIKGATVYLKNDKTSKVASVTVDESGKFRFGALSRASDYKLWAQVKDKKTPEKVISSLDTTDEIKRNLKVE